MNINKDLSNNAMDLDDDVFYNFTNATSQLMRDDGVISWRGPQEKHSLFFSILIDDFSKPEGIVANLTVSTCINPFIYSLIILPSYARNINYYVSLIILFMIVFYYVFDRTFHTCLLHFEVSLLGIGRQQRCFWFHLEAFDYAVRFTYRQRHQLWRLGWFSNC